MNRILILVNITGLIIGISYGLHGPILPLFAKNIIGASYSELGLIGLTNFVPYMFIPLFVGILLDRINNGYLLAIGAAINSVSIYLLSIAQSIPEIMGFRVLTGIAHAFFWPPCQAIIANESTEKNRVRNISWFTMFFVIGFMVGPLLGTVILEGLDVTYRILFQITAFILATAIISSLLISKKRISVHQERISLSAIKEMKRFPEVIILLIFSTASFGIAIVLMGFGFSIFFPLTLEIILSKTKKQITGKIIGAYETVFGIGWALGPTIGGPITQTFGDEAPYMVFCVIGIGVTLLAITSRKRLEPEIIQN